MASYLPALREFFPPTPKALTACQVFFKSFPLISIAQWLLPSSPMGKTSITSTNLSWLNLPGRYAWAAAEVVGPINLIYVLYSLPAKLPPLLIHQPLSPATGIFGTGLPITHEILGLLYVLHYVNRAGVTPYKAPSMSPIWAPVSCLMAIFQFTNSSSIGGWICYDAQRRAGQLDNAVVDTALISPLSVIGMVLFIGGLAGNISAEWALFDLRKAAARRKAKSEGKAEVTYEKVYVIPEAKGLFQYVMFPHYSLEWIEWTGYWILGGAWGLGWSWFVSAPAMFLVNELATMTPRAVDGVKWYDKRFGKRALAGRKAVIPGIL